MADMESLLWPRFSMGDHHLFPHATAIRVLKTLFSLMVAMQDTLHSLLISLCQDSRSFTPLLWRPCSTTITRH
ncbi:hypothetical protein SESBI_26171 [Sesbania bispinosa]|nr:hypothetical protein SESBI_26171 [Sesbania bispinosa]